LESTWSCFAGDSGYHPDHNRTHVQSSTVRPLKATRRVRRDIMTSAGTAMTVTNKPLVE